MRKAALILALVMIVCALPVGAQGIGATFTGRVVAGKTISVTAPYSGTMHDYDWRIGSTVEEGDVLFNLSTTKVYAPASGTVGSLRVKEGDSCESVQAQYTALFYVEPDSKYTISTNTKYAHGPSSNKFVHVGEDVYMKSTKSSSRTGTGFITSATGSKFTVEVTGGNLRMDDDVSIYRNASKAKNTRIGKGKVTRQDPLPVTGTGNVLHLYVEEGDVVEQGDLIMETVQGDKSKQGTSSGVLAPVSGIIASLDVTPGVEVKDLQVLATMYPAGTLEAAIEVNEMDLVDVRVGETMIIELDCDISRQYEGTVLSISSISTSESGDAKYLAYLSFENDDFVREGMSITVNG